MTVKMARMMAMVQMIVLQDQEGMLLALLSQGVLDAATTLGISTLGNL